jgi:hypothetical protein
MTLELAKVSGQIEDMGRALAERAKRDRDAQPAARELLHRHAEQQEALRGLAGSEAGRQFRCASPGEERLDLALPAPPMPERIDLLATDGSQIYPDRHGMAFYFLINIGGLVLRHGSGLAPETVTRPRLYFADEEVYPEGEPATSDLVNALRSLAEMHALADMALAEPDQHAPRLALSDGPLLLWLQRTAVPRRMQGEMMAEYLGYLDSLRRANTPSAGFVSRPHSAEVVALLYLAQVGPRPRVKGLHETRFRGLTDRALFGFLEKGERSALYVRGTAANEEFASRGQAIWFFYLSTGTDVARVEVPEWVARRPDWLDLVHASAYDQCLLNNGYPYVLTRADELAVVLGAEREVLEAMLARAMARHELDWPELSRKALQKRVARWRS